MNTILVNTSGNNILTGAVGDLKQAKEVASGHGRQGLLHATTLAGGSLRRVG